MPSDQTQQKLKEFTQQRSISGPEGLGHTPVRVPYQPLMDFTTTFFVRLGLTEEEARGAAEVLVTSDLRNIESHGVPRLDMYLHLFRAGMISPNAPYTVVRETPATALVDGGNGLGLVVARKAMQLAIDKAKAAGVGLVAVTNSTHFGIAGYHAERAIAHDMIGMAMTNAGPLVVPTFGTEARLGTNPIAFAAPAKEERPFLLDMATSAVAYGKIEIAARLERAIPVGWGLDENGQPTTDPFVVLRSRRLTSLGSTDELSSFKGYGLGAMVDILTGVLSGMGHSMKVQTLRAGHFFGAIRIDAFRDADEFKAEMDELIRDLHNTPKVEGATRVYVAGEKEYLAQEENLKLGVPLHPKVVYRMKQLAQELDIPWPLED